MSMKLRAKPFWRARYQQTLTRLLVETPEALPWWAGLLLPQKTRAYLEGLKRIAATPLARPKVDRVEGRTLTIGAERVTDFATGAYLGLDFDVTGEDLDAVRAVGLRNGWSRASGTTPPGRELEEELAARLGFEACRVAASISLLNLTLFYSLKHLFPIAICDADAHLSIKRGLRAAYPSNALFSFANNDMKALETLLEGLPRRLPKLIAVDGVYSMRGTRADLERLLPLCRRFNATCYLDDAHGFGVLGEEGLGVVEALAPADRARCILVGSFSKACSNPIAFVAFPEASWYGIDAADAFSFCGPPSNLHAIIALRHLRAFDRLAGRRRQLEDTSRALHAWCAALGLETLSTPGLPLLCVRIADQRMEACVATLAEHAIHAKIAIFPVVRPGHECVRFGLTALHDEAHLAALRTALVAMAGLPRLAAVGS